MRSILYAIAGLVARIHNYILSWNDSIETSFTDKELHFLVIGVLGMMMIFVVYPFFKWLAKNNHIMTISWIYVFTLIIVITFAIEIGQKVTNTGNMEFADIMFGLVGFLLMYGIFAIIRELFHMIVQYIRKQKKKKRRNL